MRSKYITTYSEQTIKFSDKHLNEKCCSEKQISMKTETKKWQYNLYSYRGASIKITDKTSSHPINAGISHVKDMIFIQSLFHEFKSNIRCACIRIGVEKFMFTQTAVYFIFLKKDTVKL